MPNLGYVGLTDSDWNAFHFARRPFEVNFWQPGGSRSFVALRPGDPFFFRSKKAQGGMITGAGLFASFVRLPLGTAWDVFGEANGAATEHEMIQRVRKYVPNARSIADLRAHEIGCIILTEAEFFEPALWFAGPRDWADNIVSGKTIDVDSGDGARIWNECLTRSAGHVLPSAAQPASGPLAGADSQRFGAPRSVLPRLGQQSFRAIVIDRYDRACAVTGEHSLPVLEAAHIKPFAVGGEHRPDNGLLMRVDLHRLFDKGYVTVTPDNRFRVSTRLRDEFNNGRIYYELDGRDLRAPRTADARPAREFLEWHADTVFLG